MKSLNPYLNFGGKCQEALNFYQECFKGEILVIQTFEDAKMDVDDAFKSTIMHSEFRAEDIHFMASDGMPGHAAPTDSNISLNINFTDQKEQAMIFAALASGGKVTLALHDAFWGARFGMLTDRYGIHWMLNCHQP